MRLTYDPRYNIAYVRFQEKQADVETIRISDEVVVDMAPDGTDLRRSGVPSMLCCLPKIAIGTMTRNVEAFNSCIRCFVP